MKSRIIILSVIITVLAGAFVMAQPGRKARMGDREREPMARISQMLDLTDEQQDQLGELHLSQQRAMLPLRSQLRSLKDELKLVQTADNFDNGKAESIVKKMSGLQAEMQLKRIANHQKVRSMLTDTQRKKFDAHFLTRGERGGEGHGGHGRHGRGIHRGNGPHFN